MTILTVFGTNLRMLCDRRGAQSEAARAIGISRGQFQRFLKGTSFPKPDQLKIICDHFSVDARILTEPLDSKRVRATADRQDGADAAQVNPGMAEAVAYACATQDYFEQSSEFPDGLYLCWRHSMSQPEKVACTLMLVKTLRLARVVRGLDLRSMYVGQAAAVGTREFKGILYRQQFGYSVIFYHAKPTMVVSQTFISPVGTVKSGLLLFGFTVLGRLEYPGLSRMSRCVWQRVERNWPAAMAAARQQGLMAAEDVPSNIGPLLSAPLK